ncbi:MAG: DoxX family protein [Mucilaginibacter sp.]|nr:DoxX family protein [Mucilaginibacter sp.]
MRKIMVACLVTISGIACGQHKINHALKKQMDSIMVLDQKYRDTLMMLMNPQKADSTTKSLSFKAAGDASTHYWRLQNRLDSLNVVFIESVFNKYGYPGRTLVDTPANKAAWYIIQHSNKIHQYMLMMKKAADENELPYRLYAMMLDRDLMNQGKEQVYGTQVICRKFKNITDECIVWPIKDPEKVNERRKTADFTSTVEQNAIRLGVAYRVIKLSDIQ